jgi:hypothetical protein
MLFEELDPGFGFVTWRGTEKPAWAAVAVPVAIICVLETDVTVRVPPPKATVAPLTKLVPDIVRVNAPTVTCGGETLEICGMGFQSVTALEPVADFLVVSVASIVTVLGEGRVEGAV